MGFLLDIWNGLKGGLETILRLYEGFFEPVIGNAAWGVAIILLTVTVRVFMIPLMVRQTKSMRAMQALQPELKKIQEKYKADRSMMKTDPERYKKIKEKQREAQMALYQEHGANPVGGCLPLLLQMPVFLALFQVLQGGSLADELGGASFLGITSLTDTARNMIIGGETFLIGAALTASTLILLQVGTTFYTQKQMMARNVTAAAEQQQAQKMMLYVMPGFLGFLSFTFPIGVVLYWVTTNVWTIGQQAFIFRQIEAEEARKSDTREEDKPQKSRKKQADAVAGAADQSAEVVEKAEADGATTGTADNGGKPPAHKPGGKPAGGKANGSKAAGGKSNASRAERRAQAAGGAARPTRAGQRRQRGSGRPPQSGGTPKGSKPGNNR